VVGATAAILIATAGAVPGPEKPHSKLNFTSTAAVLKFLKSHGVNTQGIVVQRGVRNYAGARCPGKKWNCTRAHRVIQFATLASTFQCSPSYPTGGSSTPPDSCVVVQVNTTGDNSAKCVEETSADGAQQNCDITQTNVSGKNDAVVFQLIHESGLQHQTGRQDASVKQDNCSGSNNSAVAQTILQTTSTTGPVVNQDQQARQSNHISQNHPPLCGGTNFSVMSHAVVQKAAAGSGGEDASSSFAPFAVAAFTGSQNQFGDGHASVNQTSTGVSKSYNFQNMLQIEQAPPGVTQKQVGPYRCCSLQQSNPNDFFYLEQGKKQFRSAPVANQTIFEDGFLETTGHGHIDQFAQQNNATKSNACDVNNGACVAQTAGVNGVITKCSDNVNTEACSICPPSLCSFAPLGLTPNTSPNHRAFRVHYR
jgi:hypothetical protein